MIVTRGGPAAFTLQFESDEELRQEHESNLAHGALRLPTGEEVPLHATLAVTLRGPWGGEAAVRGTVVARMDGALALGVDGYDDAARAALESGRERDGERAVDDEGDAPGGDAARGRTAWDRIRGLSQMEKILLAVKAERSERALMLQDNDPRVLLSLLRNPRITIEEVARMTRSPFLTYQVAEAIMKSAQWMASPEVKVGLVNNPKTPQAFALRILPLLPDNEVRAVARNGTSMALKQAALRRLQGK